MISSTKADLLILFIVVIWGATFPFIHNSLAYTTPSNFMAARFILAIILFFPFVCRRLSATNGHLLLASAVLGLLNGCGYYLQTLGLNSISSSESAFITSMTVIIIPLLLPFFKLGRPSLLEGGAALFCLFGVYILSGSNFHHLSFAYLWTFICAGTTALAVLYLQKVSPGIKEYGLFSFYQLVFCASVPIAMSLWQQNTYWVMNRHLLIALVYCAILASIVPFFLLSRYQQYTNPIRVGIIFTLEPIFASIFAYFFNDEVLTRSIYIGGAIILASLLLNELSKIKHKGS